MAKRRGQWVGDRRAQTIENLPSTTDVIQLLEPADNLESIRDIVFERCVLNFSVHRLTTNTVTDAAWMVYLGRVNTGTVIPQEALNPRDASKFTMAQATILQVGVLPIPGTNTTFDSAGAIVTTATNREVMTVEYDFHVKRSVARGSEGIFLTMACSGDEIIQANVLWRVYYTYA